MPSLDVVNNQIYGFPRGSVVKIPPDNSGDTGVTGSASSIPGSGRSPTRKNGNPLLPRQSHGLSSLEGYNLGGCKELDTTGWLSVHTHVHTHTHTHTPQQNISIIPWRLSKYPSLFQPLTVWGWISLCIHTSTQTTYCNRLNVKANTRILLFLLNQTLEIYKNLNCQCSHSFVLKKVIFY